MRALAMTGMLTASMIPMIISGSDMRATPPAARMSDGTRSSAITATAPASSAILAWSGVTTSMITPPLSIWARPFLVAQVDVSTVICAWYSGWHAGSAGHAGRGVVARSSRPGRLARRDYRTPFGRSPFGRPRLLRVELEARHVVREDRPGERPNRAQLPQAALAPVVRGRLVAL